MFVLGSCDGPGAGGQPTDERMGNSAQPLKEVNTGKGDGNKKWGR